jgi:hypothetical protein
MSPRKHTPDEEASKQETATAVADQPATEGGESNPGFADRVGRKTYAPVPDPFGIASDYQAGVRLLESRRDRVMAIKFGGGGPEDKPSQAVIDLMKESGYRWNPSDRMWTHAVRFETAMTTRIDAERLYQEVCALIREEKGIEPGQKTPF